MSAMDATRYIAWSPEGLMATLDHIVRTGGTVKFERDPENLDIQCMIIHRDGDSTESGGTVSDAAEHAIRGLLRMQLP